MITIKVDTSGFDKVFKEYMKYSHRSLEEACNQHAYYASRDMTQTTHAATKEEIQTQLSAESSKYPKAPMAAILVNYLRGKEGKKGLTGEKMTRAAEKLIKSRVAHRNFLRAGWIPAIKKLSQLVPKKNGTHIPGGTDKKGRNYGGAKPANSNFGNWNVFTSIWNSATGKGNTEKSLKYITEGAKKGIEMEAASMKRYIEKKRDEAAKRFWGS